MRPDSPIPYPESPNSSSSWPSGYLPDLPEVEKDDEDNCNQAVACTTDDEDAGNADNDTTVTFSTDEEVLPLQDDVPTLEVHSDGTDESVSGESSSDSEIPTGYNSETGELYQNQLGDRIVAEKYRKQFM